MRKWLLWAPLVAFLALFALIAAGLINPASRKVPSRLVGAQMPRVTLPALVAGHPGLTGRERGPRLINIFASWCVPCAAEVVQLRQLQKNGVIIDGIAIRDTKAALGDFLKARGDPYRAIGDDAQSRSMIALGSSGVPESFIVDARGIIRYQHVGAINAADVARVLQAYDAAGRS